MDNRLYFSDYLFRFCAPPKLIAGVGAAESVGREAKLLGANRALIITERKAVKAGRLKDVQEALKSEEISIGIFEGVQRNLVAKVIEECGRIARTGRFDILIGVGGGNVLDTAKGASIMVNNEGKLSNYAGLDKVPGRGLPKILVPTEVSGAEVTRVIAPFDQADRTTKVISSNVCLADVAVIDPLLMLSLSPDSITDGSVQALAAAIEAIVSDDGTRLSTAFAREAITLIRSNLPAAYRKADSIGALFNLGLAAAMAKLACQSYQTDVVQVLSRAVETECGLRRDRACGIMLPHVMVHRRIGSLAKLGQIAEVLGENVIGLTEFEAADKAIIGVKELLAAVDIPTRLSDCGVTKESLPRLVKAAMKQADGFGVGRSTLTKDGVKKMYLRAIEG